MEHSRFHEVFEKMVDMCRDLLIAKNAEYARGEDKLHNFKKAAGFGGTQETALAGMMLKHTVSVYDMVDDVGTGNIAPTEKWEEKIMDHINYLLLLYAMIVERDDLFSADKKAEYAKQQAAVSSLAGAVDGLAGTAFDQQVNPHQR